HALPALRQHRIPATFYIISNAIGTTGAMSAAQLVELSAAGHELGNHTASHPRLSTLTVAQVKAEFEEAQAEIREATGSTP
ncbi:polysaccharide deacetylase family protein, partial [Streptococcus pyogenes]